MDTPLLTSDEDLSPPSLSSGPAIAEESEFSRLISRSINPLQALSHRLDPFATTSPPRSPLHHADQRQQSRGIVKRGSLVTIIAGTLSLMHAGFVWGSYMAGSWSDTHLTVVIAWQKEYLPALDDLTDTVIRSTNLASLLQDLATAQQYLLVGALWVTSLLLPCFFVVLSPTWVVGDCQKSVSLERRMRTWQARGFFETTVRFSFLLMFVLVLLDLATAVIELHWTDSVANVRNRALGGLAAYVTAMASAIGVILVLRSPGKIRGSFTIAASGDFPGQRQAATIRSPPPQAFQHPWRLVDGPNMSVLEEEPEPRPNAQQFVPDASSTPELIEENVSMMTPTRPTKLSFGRKVLVFQVGLLTAVLWIPSLYLPLFRISYTGLAREFMTVSSLKVFLWQIPALMWTQGVQSSSATWILLAVGFILIAVVIVLPVVATCLGISTWLGENTLSYRSRSWLYCIHPALGGLVFAVALIVTVSALHPLGNLLLDEDGTGICVKFQQVVGEPCLTLTGTLLPGAWFFLLQSIVLEMFVAVTLRWS